MRNIRKELEKCKHPNSRKFSALAKQTLRKNKRLNAKRTHAMKRRLIGEKLIWVRNNLIPSAFSYTPVQMEEMINGYLSRFNAELEEIHSKQNSANHNGHTNRGDAIKMILERETKEFSTCGIEMPDLMNPAQLKTLREWDSDIKYLQHFKLRRFTEKYLAQQMQKLQANSNKSTTDIAVQDTKDVQL